MAKSIVSPKPKGITPAKPSSLQIQRKYPELQTRFRINDNAYINLTIKPSAVTIHIIVPTSIKARPAATIACGFDELPPEQPPRVNAQPATSANIFVVMLRLYSITFFVIGWLGHFMLYRQWPGTIKLGLCSVLGVLAIYSCFAATGKCETKPNPIMCGRSLTWREGLIVILMSTPATAFLKWLVEEPLFWSNF